MNPLIALMLLFFLLGIVDKTLGDRMGLAKGLDRGLTQMGMLVMSMAGFYCIGVTLIQSNMDTITAIGASLPFDLSQAAGLLLAPDMGGYPMSMELASSRQMGLFSGILLSSGIGCLISFQLPVALTMIEKEDVPVMMEGMIPGIMAVPAGLLIGGMLLKIPVSGLLWQMVPVLAMCGLMALGFWKAYRFMEKVLTIFGMLIRILGMVLFALVAVGLFWEPIKIAEDALVYEAFTVAVKITIIVCGALSLSDLLLKAARPFLKKLSGRIGVNELSVVGLFISLASGVAMSPMYRSMDRKGKLMNSAFSVMGAYVIGGQMAFIAGMTSGVNVMIYIVSKLAAGTVALMLVQILYRRQENKL